MEFDEVYCYDLASELSVLAGPKETEANNKGWNAFCNKLSNKDLKKEKNSVVNNFRRAFIVRYPEDLIPDGVRYLSRDDKIRSIMLHKVISSAEFMNSNNILIFVSDSTRGIDDKFVSRNARVEVFELDYPDIKTRNSFIEYLFTPIEKSETNYSESNKIDGENNRLRMLKSVMKINISEFANLTSAISLVNIEDIFLLALSTRKITAKMILNRKKGLIEAEFGDVIELKQASGLSMKDYAGLDNVKDYFQEVIINAIKTNDLEIVPKGVLFSGPPGTGKTFFAKCLAGDSGVNFVELKMSKILDKYVGNSEKSLEKAFSVFQALAPVIVFIDEADQTLGRGGKDGNSVGKNLFGMFLTEMSKKENRGRVIWIAATNYPDKMDEAFKRVGRLDKKIPFFAPSSIEREAVFKIHLKKARFPNKRDALVAPTLPEPSLRISTPFNLQ